MTHKVKKLVQELTGHQFVVSSVLKSKNKPSKQSEVLFNVPFSNLVCKLITLRASWTCKITKSGQTSSYVFVSMVIDQLASYKELEAATA